MYTPKSYGTSQSVTSTRKVKAPELIPDRKAGTWLTYPAGMEGWVDLGGWLHCLKKAPSFVIFDIWALWPSAWANNSTGLFPVISIIS